MQNTVIHPAIHKINSELNKLNQIIENTKTNNYHFRTLLKNCNLSTPSSSSSILFDEFQPNSDVEGIFHQTTSKNFSSIHSNNLSDTFNKNQNSVSSKHVSREKKQKKATLFKKHHSGINFLSEKNQSNHRSTMQPSKQTIKKVKLLKSNILKSKKQITNKGINLNQSKQADRILILDAQKKILINSKSNSKYQIQINSKKQKAPKIRKVTKKKDRDTSNFQEDKAIAPTKTQESSHTEGLKSKRSKQNNHVSVPHKEKDFKSIITYRNENNKFHIDLGKQVDAKITDLRLNKKLFQLEKRYFLSSIKVTKKELQKIVMSHNKSLSSNDTLKSIFDVVREVLSSIMSESSLFNEKEKKKRICQGLNKPEVFLRTINQFPDTLKSLNSNSQNNYKANARKMRQILQKINKLSNKSVVKSSLYMYFVSLNEYLDFFVKNKLITSSKVNKSLLSKNQQLLSCRNAKNQRQKTRREMEVKSPALKKRQISQRKKEEIRILKRSSTVKILRKSKF